MMFVRDLTKKCNSDYFWSGSASENSSNLLLHFRTEFTWYLELIMKSWGTRLWVHRNSPSISFNLITFWRETNRVHLWNRFSVPTPNTTTRKHFDKSHTTFITCKTLTFRKVLRASKKSPRCVASQPTSRHNKLKTFSTAINTNPQHNSKPKTR